jgi:hypothetical protein
VSKGDLAVAGCPARTDLASSTQSQSRNVRLCFLQEYAAQNRFYNLNHWVMHPVVRVSTDICRNLRTQQISVLVLLV